MQSLKSRSIISIVLVLIALILVLPNFIGSQPYWPSSKRLNYGLDIQGGLHLVMGVDVAGVVTESVSRLSTVLKSELEKENVKVVEAKPTGAAGELSVTVDQAETLPKVEAYLEQHYPTTLQKINQAGATVTYRYFDTYLNDYKTKTIQQAIETIRNRIDEFGVAEPSISAQGTDRILIQLPGMADAEKAKSLINTTAKLDFMIVEEKSPAELAQWVDDAEKAGNYSLKTLKYSDYVTRLNTDLKSKLPPLTQVLFKKPPQAAGLDIAKIPLLVRTDTGLSGDALSDASVGYGQYGAPEVNLRFNPVGANVFKIVTGKNVGRRLAIVLDRIIKSDPELKGEIPNGVASITLGSGRNREQTLDEAKMIATTLRAGALPAALEQLEERRIGPSLGSDSIHKANIAALIGSIAILIFMLLRYRTMGVISDLCLVLNVLGVFALLTWLGATLTLPGIAGIALTVGFAVDANVLINERMREEFKRGANIQYAIQEGYKKAMSAIFDSNLTTACTACVLLYFGTGPVRGFAVTLLIGIVTTLIANVFISKVMVDQLIHRFGFKKMKV